MKAVIFTKYGSPDVLQLKEIPMVALKGNELLVKLYASTVNRTDCAILRAKPWIMRLVIGLFKPRNPIPGTDFAGEVEAIGKDVKTYNVGDRVFGFNDIGVSSKAQYMTIAEKNTLSTIPDNMTYDQAAASVEGAHYANNMLNKVEIKSGQNALVNGATGAIGSATVQLLKSHGVNVTAVCRVENMELIKSIGADQVIDYTKEDFTKRSEKYHFVFDTVGKSSFSKCKPIMETGGVYISSELGQGAENLYYAVFTPLTSRFSDRIKVVFPVPSNVLGSIRLVKKLVAEGKYKPLIDRTYTLEDIADAYRYVETGEKIGNVVIKIEHA